MTKAVRPSSPEDEKKEIKSIVDGSRLVPGETWYLISAKWFNDWKQYVSYREDSSDNNNNLTISDPPAEIDNQVLVDDLATFADEFVPLKEGLQEDVDYTLLPEKAWKLLNDWYGSNSTIPRMVIAEAKNYNRVEIHPLILRIQRTVPEGDQPDPKTEMFISSSKTATLDNLLARIAKIYNVNPTKSRLWNYYSPTQPELIYHLDLSLDDEKIITGQHLLLEVQLGNEQWPIVYRPQKRESKSPKKKTNFTSMISGWLGLAPVEEEIVGQPVHQQGLCGLHNLGNTCFMNSALQCLSNTPPLNRYFLSEEYKKEINRNNPLGMKGNLAEQYGSLMKQMWSGCYQSVPPKNFKWVLSKFAPQFSGYSQHDSQELLAFVLDGLHEDLNRITKKPYIEEPDNDGSQDDSTAAGAAWERHRQRNQSVIVDNFHGQLKSKLVCPDCNKVSVTFDPFMFLSLPLPSNEQERPFRILVYPYRKDAYPVLCCVWMLGSATQQDVIGSVLDLSEKDNKPAEFENEDPLNENGEKKDTPNDGAHANGLGTPSSGQDSRQSQRYRFRLDPSRMFLMTVNDSRVLNKVNLLAANFCYSPSTINYYKEVLPDSVPGQSVLLGYPTPPPPEKKKDDKGLLPSSLAYNYPFSSASVTLPPMLDRSGLWPAVIAYQFPRDYQPPQVQGRSQQESATGVGKDAGALNLILYFVQRRAPEDVTTTSTNATTPVPLSTSATVSNLIMSRLTPTNTTSTYRLFGMPFILVAHRTWTRRTLHRVVWSRVRRMYNYQDGKGMLNSNDLEVEAGKIKDSEVDSNMEVAEQEGETLEFDGGCPEEEFVALENGGSGLPFVLRTVNSNGSGCICRTPKCVGCIVLPDDQPINLARNTTIAIDWEWNVCSTQKVIEASVEVVIHPSLIKSFSRMVPSDEFRRANHVSLFDCINLFTSNEKLSTSNPWYCPCCKEMRRANKKMDVWKLPKILIVHLKRFRFTRHPEKVTTFVEYPLTDLDLSSVVNDPQEKENAVYDLIAVSNHSGHPGGGHYTAYAKNVLDKKWYLFNDSSLTEVSSSKIRGSDSYVLFYKRKDRSLVSR